MWTLFDKPVYANIVEAFYANNGKHFGAFDSMVKAQLAAN
jgi:hypothetical protein